MIPVRKCGSGARRTRFAHMAAPLVFVSFSGNADAGIKVYVGFIGDEGFSETQQQQIIDGVKARFDFTVDGFNVGENLEFINDLSNADTDHRLLYDHETVADPWGKTFDNVKSVVYIKQRRTGPFKDYFNTDAKMITSIIFTGTHEIAHQFLPGEGHNCHAPNEVRTITVGGQRYKAEKGDGTLVNGKIGLMVLGSKMLPEELAADGTSFTDAEKKKIAAAVKKEIEGKKTKPSGNSSGRLSDIQPVRGQRFSYSIDPALQTDWTEPFPVPSHDDSVDFNLAISGNGAFDLGFASADGGFVGVVDAGVSSAMMGFEPGDIVNLAIRAVGQPDEMRLAFSDYGRILDLSEPVSASRAVEPVVDRDYYRRATLEFDLDGDPMTPGVLIELSMGDDSNLFDGFRVVPSPSCGVAFSLVCLGAAIRRRA